MKTIGLIGGMSRESTQTYYRLINQRVREMLGGLHSARLVLYSVDFAEIEALQQRGSHGAMIRTKALRLLTVTPKTPRRGYTRNQKQGWVS